jgi:hypothetical protein
MLTPMRSFTLAQGFELSSFATTSAAQPSVTLFNRTSGVLPINPVTSFAIFIFSFAPKGLDAAGFHIDPENASARGRPRGQPRGRVQGYTLR